jgi:RHS repeat-associated protein
MYRLLRSFVLLFIVSLSGIQNAMAAAPTRPASLTVPATSSNGEYTLTWSASSGFSGFVKQYRIDEQVGAGPILRDVVNVSSTQTSYTFSGKPNGVYTYFIKACNLEDCSSLRQGSNSITVTIVEPNEPPVANAGTNQTVDHETTVTLSGGGTDSDGTITTYRWDQTWGPTVSLANPNAASTTFEAPTVSVPTEFIFELTVTDDNNAQSTDTVSITVLYVAPNTPPAVDAGIDQTVNESAPVTLTGSGTDDDGTLQSFQWSQISGPIVTLQNSNTLNASFTAPDVVASDPNLATASEELRFELAITDDEGGQGFDEIYITVNNVNSLPIADAGLNQSVDEAASVSLSASGSSDPDSDGSIVTYLWTQTAGTTANLSGTASASLNFTAPEVTADENLIFSVTVTDNDGGTDSDSVTVTVNNVNKAPNANAGTNQTVNEGTTVTLAGSASNDPDGSIATYQWVQTAGLSASLSGAATDSPTFTAPEVTVNSTLTFQLTVTDNEGLTDTDSVTVTSTHVNKLPVAEAGAHQTVDEETEVTLSGSGTDEDGTIASYSWVQTAGTAVTLNTPNAASTTFDAPNVTIAEGLTFELTVTDNDGASHTDSVTLTVRFVAPNNPPTVDAGADQTVNEEASVVMTGSGTDDDGTLQSYQWTQLSGPTVTLQGANTLSASFTAPEVVASDPVLATADEVLRFELAITDDDGGQGFDEIFVTVTNVNGTPTADAGVNQTVDESDLVSLSASGSSDSDTDGSIVSYSWTQTSGTLVSLSSATAASPTFTAPEVTLNENLIFSVTVTDNDGGTDSDSVTVTVNNVNKAPNANAGTNQTVNEGTTVTLAGSASNDPDGSIATYQWVQTAGLSASLSGAATDSPTFTAPEVTVNSTLTFQLTVTDNEGLTDTDSVTVTSTHVNKLPVAEAGAHQTVDEETEVTLSGSGTDEDGTIASYSWVQTAGTAVTLNTPNAASTTFDAPNVTIAEGLTFELTVTDNDGASHTDSVTLTVRFVAPNNPPTVDAGADQTVNEEASVVMTGSGTDDDGTLQSYQWTQLSGPTVTLQGANTLSASFTAPSVSNQQVLRFELAITDDDGGTGFDEINITVTNVNKLPIIDPIANQNVEEGDAVILSASASDPDGGTLTYDWVQVGTPIVGMTGNTTSAMSFTAPNVTGTTTLNFTLTVTDEDLESASSNVSVIVNQLNNPPVVDPIPNQSVVETETVTLTVNATDPDGDSLSYQWIQNGTPAVIMTGPTSATMSFPAPAISATTDLNFSVTVTDGNGGEVVESVVVTVTEAPVNQAPTVSLGSDISTSSGSAVAITPVVSDENEQTISYAWTEITTHNIDFTVDAVGTLSFDAPAVDVETNITFELVVTDEESLIAADQITVTVVPAAGEAPDWANKNITAVADGLTQSTPIIPGNVAIGALEGQAGVSGGSATYSIPIALPPGRAGMQPSVALNYSSRSGNGIAGIGWGVSAGSAIQRCGKMSALDTFSKSVTYSGTEDRLCLDGQRLILTSGTTYGANLAEYRTEQDTFVRVTQYGALNSLSTSFKVEDKSGVISLYGDTANSRFSPQNVDQTLSWSVRQKADQVGNNIHYYYNNPNDGTFSLERMVYTGFADTDGDREVVLNYENRDDVITSYLAGGLSKTVKRLAGISTYYANQLIRDYQLRYDYSQTSNRSILVGVTECSEATGTRQCLPETEFNWFNDPVSHTAPQVDEIVNDLAVLNNVDIADLDGDGLPEYLRSYDGLASFFFGAAASTDIIKVDENRNIVSTINSAEGYGFEGVSVDLDLNGKTERAKVNWALVSSTQFKFFNSRGITHSWLDEGAVVSADIDFASQVKVAKKPSSPRPDVSFADMNADGYPDLLIEVVVSKTRKLALYLHNGDAANIGFDFWGYVTDLDTGSYYRGAYAPLVWENYSVQDINGDGIGDIALSLRNEPSQSESAQFMFGSLSSDGTLTFGSRLDASTLGLPDNSFHNFFTWTDVNGDGLSDYVSVEGTTSTYWAVRLNLGDGSFAAELPLGSSVGTHNWDGYAVISSYQSINGLILTPSSYAAQYERAQPLFGGAMVMDYDGDGKSDLLVATEAVDTSCYTTVNLLVDGSEETTCDDDLHRVFNKASGDTSNTSIHPEKDLRQFKWSLLTFQQNSNGTFTTSVKNDLVEGPLPSADRASFQAKDINGDGMDDFVVKRGIGHCVDYDQYDICTASRENIGIYAVNAIDEHAGDLLVMLNTTSKNGENIHTASDSIQSVVDGLGNTSSWEYSPLGHSAGRVGETKFYDVPTLDLARYIDGSPDSENFYFASSMHVVSEFLQSDAIGGENTTQYSYREAIYNRKGRGFQGFRTIIVDNPTDIRSVTDFHQIFPKAGKIEEARTCLTSSDELCTTGVISKTNVTYFDKTTANSYVHWVVPISQVATSYDLVTGNILSEKATTINELDVDAYGNVLRSENIVDTGFSEVKSVTVNNYTNDANDWWFKLDNSTVTIETLTGSALHEVSLDPKKEIKTTYTYTANRQPDVVTVEPILGGGFTTSVDTDYNAYGLPTKVTTTSQGESRSIETRYSNDGETESNDGYFVYKVTNDLDHSVTTKTYPEHGQVKEVIDANGLSSSTEYDAFGRIEKVTPPLGTGQPAYSRFADCLGGCDEVLSIIEGDFASNVAYKVTTTAAGAPETTLYKDKFNRVLVAKTQGFDGSPIFVRTEYDGLGRKVFESVPSFVVDEDKGTHWVRFDEQGRLLEKKLDEPTRLGTAQWFSTTYAYNDHQTSIDAVGTTKTLPTMYRTYNGIGQLMKTTDAKGGVTEYAYDAQGNPIVLQDANSNAITAKYNALGQKEYVIDPNMGRKDFTYKPFGEIDTETDALSVVTEYGYDTLGRLTSRTAGGVLEASFVYDSASQGGTTDTCVGAIQSEVRNDSGADNFNKVYSYDNYCRPSSVTTNIGAESYTQATQYDGFYGRVKGSQTVTGITLETQYNDYGYATKSLNAASGYVYQEVTDMDARLNLTAAFKANGILNEVLAYTHETGQMESVHTDTNVGGSQRHRIDYEYDDFGNLALQKVENIRNGSVILSSESYDYDDLHRLINSSQDIDGAISNIGYVYDAVGNILSKGDFGNGFVYGDLSRATDNAGPNAVVSVNKNTGGTATYEYDLNGNMTNGDGKTLTYNAFNKPLTITKGGITSTFSYAADQMRYKQVKTGLPGGTETTIYIDKAYEEITQDGVTKKRSYLGDAIVTETIGGSDAGFKIGFVHRDRLGSTVTITNENGDVVDNKSFDPFGKPREGTFERVDSDTIVVPATLDFIRQLNNYEEHTNRGFTDHEHLDDSELIHMNGRVYDYNLGRFLSVDPFIQSPGNSQSMNPYSYIMNNPLAGTDPSGYTAIGASCWLDESCGPGGTGGNDFSVDFNTGAVNHFDNGTDNRVSSYVYVPIYSIEKIGEVKDEDTGEVIPVLEYHVSGGTYIHKGYFSKLAAAANSANGLGGIAQNYMIGTYLAATRPGSDSYKYYWAASLQDLASLASFGFTRPASDALIAENSGALNPVYPEFVPGVVGSVSSLAGKLKQSTKLFGNGSFNLPKDLAGTFAGGRYSTRVLDEDMVLYRAGVSKEPYGQFFSKDRPLSEIQARIDKAVLPQWPGGSVSPIDSVHKFLIPKGTVIHTGKVSSQGGHFVGGTKQIVIERPWFNSGIKLLNTTPLK